MNSTSDFDRIMAMIETDPNFELDEYQKNYLEYLWEGYMPGARLSLRFYRRQGYRSVWETDTTLMFLDSLREGSRSHLAVREMLYYRSVARNGH